MDKVRLALRRTFFTGEGELRQPGAASLLVGLLLVILLLELVSQAPVALYLALFLVIGYVGGERRRNAAAPEVESVAPPYIPSAEGL